MSWGHSQAKKTHCPNGHEYNVNNTCFSGGKRHCLVCIRERSKKRSPEQRHRYNLRSRFDISLEEYNDKLKRQSFSCAICKKLQSVLKKRLAVDHNHKSNVIRGLICEDCNLGLGKFQDSPELLKAATSYLEKYANVPNTH